MGFENCVVSEITIAELKYGIAKSSKKEKNQQVLDTFQSEIDILPIFPALYIYATEKARLKTKGKIVDDFDLLIGATAIHNNLTLVTKNLSDFDRLDRIIIEDWTTDYPPTLMPSGYLIYNRYTVLSYCLLGV